MIFMYYLYLQNIHVFAAQKNGMRSSILLLEIKLEFIRIFRMGKCIKIGVNETIFFLLQSMLVLFSAVMVFNSTGHQISRFGLFC